MNKNKLEIICGIAYLLSMLMLYVPIALDKPTYSDNEFSYTRLSYTSPFEQAGIVIESFTSILGLGIQRIGYGIYIVTGIAIAYIESRRFKSRRNYWNVEDEKIAKMRKNEQ